MFEINGIKFTQREVEIMACLLSGHSRKVLASLLGISMETVHSHVKRIKFKTKCYSKDQLLNFIEYSKEYFFLHKKYIHILKNKKLV